MEEAEPGYYKFIKDHRNTCRGKGISLGDLWDEKKGEEKTPG